MNNEILSRLNGDSKEYLSIDTIADDENGCLQNSIPIEIVNLITPNGLPPQKLILRINAIIILSRNLNFEDGLCNVLLYNARVNARWRVELHRQHDERAGVREPSIYLVIYCSYR